MAAKSQEAIAVVQTLAKRLFTFEEYLSYEDGTDNRYELVNGELVPMNPPIGKHARMHDFYSGNLIER